MSRFSQATRNENEKDYASQMEEFIKDTPYSNYEKMQNWPLFAARQDITKQLAKMELFKKVLDVHGSVVECGVLFGGSLMLWAQLSAIMEPNNYQRRIIGFDTFSGVESLSDLDGDKHEEAKDGGFNIDSYETLQESIRLFDKNRAIGHIPKVELVEGDACRSIKKYNESNPHLVVSLLFLDFDIYLPTKAALEGLVPNMPKGAVIVFDELNNPNWPGETQAAKNYFKRNQLELKRIPYCPNISYAVL